jgi:hypothetical protein
MENQKRSGNEELDENYIQDKFMEREEIPSHIRNDP